MRKKEGAQMERQAIDPELLKILACPKCKADVVLQDDRLVCTKCGLRYPIRDGIPIMLVEEAEPGEPPQKTEGEG